MNTIEKISVSQLKNIGLEMSVLDDDIILSNNIEIKNKIFDTPCRLDGFVLLFCTNGEAEIQINFQEYKIHPGILVMNIPENVIYISNVKKQVKMVPWNGFIYGVMIVLILNSFVFPYIFNKQIVETDYGTFISNIEKGEVQEVSIDQNCIYFATKENGKPVFYKTGAIDDPELVDRLLNAKSSNESGKIIFNKQIPIENSPLVNFMLMWIVPGVLFYLLWWGTSSLMKKRMGGAPGNVMSFGNSGAKIYADSEVKTTFADVAGQEEAKEGLNEIVDFLHNPAKLYNFY